MAWRSAWMLVFLLLGSDAWAFPEDHGGKEPFPEPQIGQIRKQNFDNLERLRTGMSRKQVADVMGERKDLQTFMFQFQAEILSNPHRIVTLQGKDRLPHVVHYYYAYHRKSDQKITTDELCPLIYRDGFLEGWGWPYYEKAIGQTPSER